MIDRGELEAFVGTVNIGVVSSLSDDQTQSAAVGITFIPEKFEFIVGTSVLSRKYKNISSQPKVSLAMVHEKKTLQLEGTVTIVGPDDNGFKPLQERVIEIHPYKKIFADDPEQTWLVVKPNWLRLTDISMNPWQIQEERV